ncbi:hypothetical protein HNQ56_000237 [Anaerotaenia torta]|uniref:DUF4867 family protein n=1 Tax=Anaerotaenia torta TaxID=433293 RepID=UPI003D1FDAC3
MERKSVKDRSFQRYGRILKDVDLTGLLEVLKQTHCPPEADSPGKTDMGEAVEYVASLDVLEATEAAGEIRKHYYGGMPIEVGYCNGHNWTLNALEYHKDSEINIAATDAVLLLGDLRDITEDLTYDTSLVEAFHLPAGMAVELYATTLHYAPCSYGPGGFQVGIVLPRGTNGELEEKPEEIGASRLLFAVNKWLLAHGEAQITGAHIGLRGENIQLPRKIS